VGRHGRAGGLAWRLKGTLARAGVPAGTFGWSGFGASDRFRFGGPAADAGMILVLGLLLAAAVRMPMALLCAIASDWP